MPAVPAIQNDRGRGQGGEAGACADLPGVDHVHGHRRLPGSEEGRLVGPADLAAHVHGHDLLGAIGRRRLVGAVVHVDQVEQDGLGLG